MYTLESQKWQESLERKGKNYFAPLLANGSTTHGIQPVVLNQGFLRRGIDPRTVNTFLELKEIKKTYTPIKKPMTINMENVDNWDIDQRSAGVGWLAAQEFRKYLNNEMSMGDTYSTAWKRYISANAARHIGDRPDFKPLVNNIIYLVRNQIKAHESGNLRWKGRPNTKMCWRRQLPPGLFRKLLGRARKWYAGQREEDPTLPQWYFQIAGDILREWIVATGDFTKLSLKTIQEKAFEAIRSGFSRLQRAFGDLFKTSRKFCYHNTNKHFSFFKLLKSREYPLRGLISEEFFRLKRLISEYISGILDPP